MKYYFIINPHSQTGQGRRIWEEQFRPYLIKQKAHWKAFYTRRQGQCTEIVSRLTKNATAPMTLIILGGDGTLNEAVNGLHNTQLVTLGYIPTGSSNDFARGMKLTKSPAQMLHNILNKSHETWLDCGVVRAPGKKEQRFIVSSGIGYDASVTDEALDSSIKTLLNRFHLGKLTYTCIALKQLCKIRLQTVTIVLDEKKVIHTSRFYFASSHNLPYEGGGFKFTPKAVPDDGYLDLCLIHTLPKLKALCLLPTAYWGGHVRFHGVQIHKFRHMRIFLEQPFPVHTDGETYRPQSQLDVWCEPKKIHFVY